MTHSAAKPKEANATGRQAGPFPISDRRSVNIDAPNPTLLDSIANEYFVAPSGRELAWDATRKTDNPMTEARRRLKNAAILLHTGVAKRGFKLNHRTQPQIREGIGSTYPAKPMSVTRMSTAFLTLATSRTSGIGRESWPGTIPPFRFPLIGPATAFSRAIVQSGWYHGPAR